MADNTMLNDTYDDIVAAELRFTVEQYNEFKEEYERMKHDERVPWWMSEGYLVEMVRLILFSRILPRGVSVRNIPRDTEAMGVKKIMDTVQ